MSASEGRSRVEIVSERESRPYSPDYFDLASPDHFWVAWRHRAALGLAADHGLAPAAPLAVLDVGCGSGVVRAELEAATSWRVDGTDLDRDALARVPEGRGRIFLYDVAEKRERFREAYDLLLLFDVLEHVAPTGPFLEALAFHLKPGGHLLLNVPALPSLFGRYDVAAGHHRRYARRALLDELRGQPLVPLEARYWGLSLIPLVVARKLMLALSPRDAHARGFAPPNRLANGALRSLMALETRLLRRPPLGASLLLLAQRR
jgi:2-polyprenyl-3-methyl-5-hydroxy-6-metoxy-1,4-benzoquinol methylase